MYKKCAGISHQYCHAFTKIYKKEKKEEEGKQKKKEKARNCMKQKFQQTCMPRWVGLSGIGRWSRSICCQQSTFPIQRAQRRLLRYSQTALTSFGMCSYIWASPCAFYPTGFQNQDSPWFFWCVFPLVFPDKFCLVIQFSFLFLFPFSFFYVFHIRDRS